ncbi:hypothetical protein HYALB_00001931, partial [Hymenoscyphus albidus]
MPTPTFSARPTRSRYSSPFANGTGTSASESSSTMAEAAPRQKLLTDMWHEPAIAAPRPSFAEAGFERGVTVANMAPLGTLPSQKILKAAGRGEVRDGLGRVKQSEASPATTPETPEPPILNTPRRSPSARVEDTLPSPKTPQHHTSSPPKVAENAQKEPLDRGVSTAASAAVSTASQSPLPLSLEHNQIRPMLPEPFKPAYVPELSEEIEDDDSIMVDLETTDKVIEIAVERAVTYRRYPTAYALRILYDDNRNDDRFVRLIEANFYCTASHAQREEFNKLLKEKKREGKKDRTAEYYFIGDGSDPPPRPVLSAVSAALTYDSPAGAGGIPALIEHSHGAVNPASPHEFDYTQLLKKQKQTHVSPYPPISAVFGNYNGPSLDKPYKSVYSSIYAQKPPTPTQNGTPTPVSASAPILASSPPVVSAPTASMTRTRSGSVSSCSSLSSVDEDFIQENEGDSQGLPSAVGDVPSPRSSRKKRAVVVMENGHDHDHHEASGDEYIHDEVLDGVEKQPAVARAWNFSARTNKKKGKKRKGSKGTGTGTGTGGKAAAHASASATAPGAGPANNTRATRASSNFASASDHSHSNLPSSRISSRHSTQEPLQLHNNHRQSSTQPQPIPATQPPKPKTGPKTFTFSTVPRSSNSAASTPTSTHPSAPSNNNTNSITTRRSNNANAASANAKVDMAPARLVQESAPAPTKASENNPYFPSGIKLKIHSKHRAPLEPESEETIRLKREARERTNGAVIQESFERHHVQPPQADETASEGGDFVPLPLSRRPTKKRILNTRETRNRYNHGSENSSPTQLSFQPDLPFGSVSTSRAGTPLVGSRPTRKAKGPRTKTSMLYPALIDLGTVPRPRAIHFVAWRFVCGRTVQPAESLLLAAHSVFIFIANYLE